MYEDIYTQTDREVLLADLIETAYLVGQIDGEAQRQAFAWMYTQPAVVH